MYRLGGADGKPFVWKGLRRGRKADEACERGFGKSGFLAGGVRRHLAGPFCGKLVSGYARYRAS